MTSSGEGGDSSGSTATSAVDSGAASDSSDGSSSGDGTAQSETTADADAEGDGADDSSSESQSANEEGSDDADADGADDGDDASTATSEESDQPRSPAVAVTRVSAEQASRNLERGDAISTQRAVQGLNLPELSGRSTPSVQSISGFLQQLKQRVANP